MNGKQQKPHSVFCFGFRPTVSVYSVSVSAKNFHFGASLGATQSVAIRQDVPVWPGDVWLQGDLVLENPPVVKKTFIGSNTNQGKDISK